MSEHYEEGENYREFLKFSCQGEVGRVCSFCSEWAGPPMGRCPKPYPDHSCLPEYHYLPYQQTLNEGREVDDWQPRVQLKNQHASGAVVLTDPESVAAFADKFIVKSKFVIDHLHRLEVMEFKRKKRMEEKARESRETKEKSYDDYPWADLCEDAAKLRKLRVPELNKYLKHHELKQHYKSSKEEKVKAIIRHSCLKPMGNPLRNGQTVRNQIDNRGDSSEAHDGMNEDYESDDTDPEEDEEDDSNDVILEKNRCNFFSRWQGPL